MYMEILGLAIPHLKFRRPEAITPLVKPHGYRIWGLNQQSRENSRIAPFDGETLAELLGQCLLLKSDTARSLVGKIAEEVQVMDPLDYQHTIVPFLKASLDTSQDPHSLQSGQLGELYEGCLKSYILRYVRLEPMLTNWIRSPVHCSSQCADCTSLNRFLQNPIDKVGRFRMNEGCRRHLEMALHSYTDCRHTTERKGSPHTLVVTKTREAFRKEHREWLDRANMVRTHLEELDSKPSLKTLLGVEYERIMCLSDVTTAVRSRPGAARNPSQAPRQSTSRQGLSGTDLVVVPENPPQMAGQKRKATVVVDLCSDDE